VKGEQVMGDYASPMNPSEVDTVNISSLFLMIVPNSVIRGERKRKEDQIRP